MLTQPPPPPEAKAIRLLATPRKRGFRVCAYVLSPLEMRDVNCFDATSSRDSSQSPKNDSKMLIYGLFSLVNLIHITHLEGASLCSRMGSPSGGLGHKLASA